jgi:hypothetical protein
VRTTRHLGSYARRPTLILGRPGAQPAAPE